MRNSVVTEPVTGQLDCDSHSGILSADADVELMVRANHNDVLGGERLPRDPHCAVFYFRYGFSIGLCESCLMDEFVGPQR